MARVNLAGVSSYLDRHGKRRWRYRSRGRSVPLPGEPGSAEFLAAYSAAKDGPGSPVGASRIVPGSLGALITAYRSSATWRALGAMTRRRRGYSLDAFAAGKESWPVSGIRAAHIRAIMDTMADRPGAANEWLKTMRCLFKFGVERELMRENPALHVKPMRAKGAGFISWSEADIAAFEARWALGTRERLAFALLLYTGQRRGDVVRLGKQHIVDGRLVFTQRKTGRRLSLPIVAELRQALDAGPCGDLTFLVTRTGAPFADAGFGNWFRDAAKAAGLPIGYNAHGLRKAAARRLAEAGRTAHQIGAVTGHTTLSEVQRYTAAADQARLADEAMGRNKPRR